MPTVLELAGVDIPDSVDGRSLLPLLRGNGSAESTWREYMHIEYAAPFAYHALTDGREKYVWFAGDGREQLFDLENDPCELNDMAGDPDFAEKVSRWRRLMVRELTGRPEGFTDGDSLITGRPYPSVME
jgi:arylsulfatase A-like enzyme